MYIFQDIKEGGACDIAVVFAFVLNTQFICLSIISLLPNLASYIKTHGRNVRFG